MAGEKQGRSPQGGTIGANSAADQGLGGLKGDHAPNAWSPEQAEMLRTEHWTRVGPIRFPAWASTGLLIWVPATLFATAVAGAIGGERTALLTFTGLIFGLFLVLALWIDTGRSLFSLALAAIVAAVLAAVAAALLVGVSALSERVGAQENDSAAAPAQMTQVDVDTTSLVRVDWSGQISLNSTSTA